MKSAKHSSFAILYLICFFVAEALVSRRSIVESASLATIAQLLPDEVRLPNNQPFLTLSNGEAIPAVGYSFYKTNTDIEQCTKLALEAGVRCFDTGTDYGVNGDLGRALHQYAQRKNLYIAHKLSNSEQSVDQRFVKKSIKSEMRKLRLKYLDAALIHSPLTDSERRLNSYGALCDLQKAGFIRSIGVCHYGVQTLDEIVSNGLPAPQLIQLQLSPFNEHRDILQWAVDHDSRVQCAAWSRLSSVDGPQDQWALVGDIAKSKQVTKAQILVRWAVQKGFGCVPRSSSNSKVERQAILENSYIGVSHFVLTDNEMNTLDKLDIGLPAGKIKVTDGYTTDDIVSRLWDPTECGRKKLL